MWIVSRSMNELYVNELTTLTSHILCKLFNVIELKAYSTAWKARALRYFNRGKFSRSQPVIFRTEHWFAIFNAILFTLNTFHVHVSFGWVGLKVRQHGHAHAHVKNESQNYCFFFGLFPSSDILETRKHDVSETESISALRWEGRHLSFGSLRKS
jgi:hypothetical protein